MERASSPARHSVSDSPDRTAPEFAEQAVGLSGERQSREFLQATLDALPAHIAILDEQGRILAVNAAWLRFARENGLTEPVRGGAGVGQNYVSACERAAVSGAEEAGSVSVALRELAQGLRQEFYIEYPCHGVNERRWFMMRATRFVLSEPSGAVRIVVSHENITERKLAEERLERNMARMAEVNEELGQFANVLAHDLQEPLRMVSSYLGLLSRKFGQSLDEKAREYVDVAGQGAARMSELIKSLLALGRVGARDMRMGEVESREIVRKALQNLQLTVDETSARIELENLPAIRGDETLLAQLFQNLLANAIKFRGENPPVVRVGATVSPDQPGMAEFHVSDNGVGLPETGRDEMFKAFSRLHAREKFPGVGLGLAICKKIVELHGGRIWAESVPGEGTTFRFLLPLSSEQTE